LTDFGVLGPVGTVRQAIEPYRDKTDDRISAEGPQIQIPPRMVLAIAMALRELATNVVKYGALSISLGQINLHWVLDRKVSPHRLHVT
jgi:two-component sensor histidine kinase